MGLNKKSLISASGVTLHRSKKNCQIMVGMLPVVIIIDRVMGVLITRFFFDEFLVDVCLLIGFESGDKTQHVHSNYNFQDCRLVMLIKLQRLISEEMKRVKVKQRVVRDVAGAALGPPAWAAQVPPSSRRVFNRFNGHRGPLLRSERTFVSNSQEKIVTDANEPSRPVVSILVRLVVGTVANFVAGCSFWYCFLHFLYVYVVFLILTAYQLYIIT